MLASPFFACQMHLYILADIEYTMSTSLEFNISELLMISPNECLGHNLILVFRPLIYSNLRDALHIVSRQNVGPEKPCEAIDRESCKSTVK